MELDGYKPRAESCPKCTQSIQIIALHCNLGTDSFKKVNLSDGENNNLISLELPVIIIWK